MKFSEAGAAAAARWGRLVGGALAVVAPFGLLAVSRDLYGAAMSAARVWSTYPQRRAIGLALALAVGAWVQWRARPDRLDRACGFLLGWPLTAVAAGAVVAMVATWLPHYLTWPWWADTDHFAVSAMSWRAGVLPYRDLVDYNFPGPTYAMAVLGAVFGWGRTWPVYAADAAWLVVVVLALAAWSRSRFGAALPGLTAGLFVTGYYVNHSVDQVAQRDWHTATLAVVGLLAAQHQGPPGASARLLAAAALAAATATRPYAVLFLPAVALAAGGEAGRFRDRARRSAAWLGLYAGLTAVAFLPLVAAGVADDFARALAYLRPGGTYNQNSPGEFAARFREGFSVDGIGAALAAVGWLSWKGPPTLRVAARSWLLALAGALAYRPLSPVPHAYLLQPSSLVTYSALGFVLGAMSAPPAWRPSVRLLAFAFVVAYYGPSLSENCSPRASLAAAADLAAGRAPERVPPGVGPAFDDGFESPGDYLWKDYHRLLDYLRENTTERDRVANLLKRYPNPPINGPTGRLTPFPHASGLLWFRWVGPGLEPEFVRALESPDCAVVVWVPDEDGIMSQFELPRLDEAVRRHYRPEAKFGVMEVWRRRSR